LGNHVQLWLPFLTYSLFDEAFSRDLQRAQKLWNGSHRIWLLPGIKKPSSWSIEVGPFRLNEIAVPSETLNSITILHIDKEGNSFPTLPGLLPAEWRGNIPHNLLKKWLNVGLKLILGKEEIEFPIPRLKEGFAEYKPTKLKLTPGPRIADIDREGKFAFRWPPTELNFDSVSPTTEIKAMSTFLQKDEKKADHVINTWIMGTPPFDTLFPTGMDLDTISQLEKMKNCASGRLQEEILSWVGKMTTEGWTTRELSWLIPALEAKGSDSVLVDIEGEFNLIHKSIKTLYKDNRYKEIFCTKLPIRRCFGWLGYFWWELKKSIESESYAICGRCGEFISGKLGKRFCSKEENSECYRARRANDVQRFRKNINKTQK
jgi:hypothetical protein